MLERIEGIVLDIVRHNDAHNVVTLYTRQYGRMAFLTPVGKSKAGRMRNSTLMLMAVVSADVNIRPGKELYTLRQVQPERLWHAVYSNPVKTSLLFFLAEFCHKLVRQYPADRHLWAFLLNALETLDDIPRGRVANFHLAFLIRLLPIMGIEPSVSRLEAGDRFDMQKAEMVGPPDLMPEWSRRDVRNGSLLTEEESRMVPLLARMNFRNMHLFRFTREQRYIALSAILRYYSLHLPIGGDLKSLPVLRELGEVQ